MAKSLLFIPDISGFTKFVKTTEVEHSQHVISELLEVLIAANTEDLVLAEIEGDALFFYKEDHILSQERLLALIENMYTAFYSHLKLIEKNRICSCMACTTVSDLQLKIIVHAGDLQFLNVQNNRKPFGEAVIEAHRLLKNSVKSHNYCLLSNDLILALKMSPNYRSRLFQFSQATNRYDGKQIAYQYANINPNKLQLKPYQAEHFITTNTLPKAIISRKISTNAATLLEHITNYKFKHLWSVGVDEIKYNKNEVTRAGSEHMCIVNGKHLAIKVVVKQNKKGSLDYGEQTTSIYGFKSLEIFFNIETITETKSLLNVELYWETATLFHRLMVISFGKKAILNNIRTSLHNLEQLILDNKLSYTIQNK